MFDGKLSGLFGKGEIITDHNDGTHNKKNSSLPELHTIPYPDRYAKQLKCGGASAFDGETNHANSRYYVFNDYYNRKAMKHCIFFLILKYISKLQNAPAALPAPLWFLIGSAKKNITKW